MVQPFPEYFSSPSIEGASADSRAATLNRSPRRLSSGPALCPGISLFRLPTTTQGPFVIYANMAASPEPYGDEPSYQDFGAGRAAAAPGHPGHHRPRHLAIHPA